jgi:hypothetical protein
MRKVLLVFIVFLVSVGVIACGSTDEKTNSEIEEEEVISDKELDQSTPSKDETSIEGVPVDKGKEEFEEYINQVKPILSEDIAQFGADYEKLRQQSINGEIDDFTFAENIINDLLPRGHQIQAELEAMFPSKELRGAHDILIDMMAKNVLAFTEIAEAVNAGDYSRITSANELLSEARSLERDFIYEIEDLSTTYGIEL